MGADDDIANSVIDDNIEYAFSTNTKNMAVMVSQGIKNTLDIDLCGGLHTIDQAHHEIHEGCYWFADDISVSLASGDIKYWLLVTPNETNYFHSFPYVVGTGEFEVQTYEGVTVATNGTELPLYNRNRNITSSTTFKFYKDPTTPNITGCPILRNIRTGSGKGAIGDSRSENELILKPNTKYLIKVTSRAAGTFVTTHMNGYICGIEG